MATTGNTITLYYALDKIGGRFQKAFEDGYEFVKASKENSITAKFEFTKQVEYDFEPLEEIAIHPDYKVRDFHRYYRIISLPYQQEDEILVDVISITDEGRFDESYTIKIEELNEIIRLSRENLNF